MKSVTNVVLAQKSVLRSRRWVIGSLLAGAAGAALAFNLAPTAKADDDSEVMKLKGKPAPEMALQTVDGPAVKLSEQKGKVVLIDFWATWCAPCVASLPHLNETAHKKEWLDKGLVVWAVNGKERPEKVKAFLTDKKLSLTVPLDIQGTTAQTFGVEGFPTTILVGRDGKVLEVFESADPATIKAIEAALSKALNEK